MIVPPKLNDGDELRIISPSRSMKLISNDLQSDARKVIEKLGFKVSISKNSFEGDDRNNSSVSSRVEDIHAAFSDPNVKGILTTIGGVNCNQILSSLDYELIKNKPKFFCGYSDITALQTAITEKCNFVTFSGPHFSTLGMKKYSEYTVEHFLEMAKGDGKIDYSPSSYWTDDHWFLDQENRSQLENSGPFIVKQGRAEGRIIGGNLSTFVLLSGTPFMPTFENSILFIEEDSSAGLDSIEEFDRNFQALCLREDFSRIKGLVVGRFQKDSKINPEILEMSILSKVDLPKDIPILAGVDFGHTNPMLTIPIGGQAEIYCENNNFKLSLSKIG